MAVEPLDVQSGGVAHLSEELLRVVVGQRQPTQSGVEFDVHSRRDSGRAGGLGHLRQHFPAVDG